MVQKKSLKGNRKLAPATRKILLTTFGVQAEIERLTGINKGHISRMTRGQRPPSSEFIEAIGPALLNLGVRLQTAAVHHEYPDAGVRP